MADRFYIGTMNAGMQKNLKPFMIPDTAYEVLDNAYLFRGTLRKRFGSRPTLPANGAVFRYETLGSRLRFKIGTTDAGGNLAAAVSTAPLIIGGAFSVRSGDTIEFLSLSNLGTPVDLLTTGTSTVHQINTTTGALNLQGSLPNSDVYYYPSLPVMGIISNETQETNFEETYVFDTRFCYQFLADGWDRLGTKAWTGTDSDFFWGVVHRGVNKFNDILFVVNNINLVRYFDAGDWQDLVPTVRPGITVTTARLAMSFKDRLLLMNTIEDGTRRNNRVRCSQNGSPFDADGWRDDIPGKGFFIDVPNQQAIISAQRVGDKMIIFCERSTWELVYTGNKAIPFTFRLINGELGVESTHSEVPFDNVVLGVGNVGIHACNGANVNRVDELIPDEVFKIHNEAEGLERVAGIKDYFLNQVYWSFPSAGREVSKKFPDTILVFNYKDETWATFDDSITAWGYEQRGQKRVTWADLVAPLTWDTWLGAWGEETPENIARNRNILAGNQQGYLFIVFSNEPTNAPSLQVTDMTSNTALSHMKVYNHNLQKQEFVALSNYNGLDIRNYEGLLLPNDPIIVRVEDVIDDHTIACRFPFAIQGVYTGGGTLARVSRIDIWTKQFSFYADKGKQLTMKRARFNVDNTAFGEIALDYAFSGAPFGQMKEMYDNGLMFGKPIIEMHADMFLGSENKKQLWQDIDIQGTGETIQLRLYLSDELMINPAFSFSDFQLNGMIFECTPAENL